MVLNMSKHYDYLNQQIHTLSHEGLKKACWDVICDPEFLEGVASSESRHEHHRYKGGLMVHTAEVLEIAIQMAASTSIYEKVNINVLIPAVIFHDSMKVREYDSKGTKCPYANLIGHISGSYQNWVSTISHYNGMDQNLIDQVGHCILAHHGRMEWGSIIEPQTAEAYILHYADMLSAKYGKNKEFPNEF